MSKPEVVPDVRLQSARRNVSRVWQTIRFYVVGFTLDEFYSTIEIDDRQVKATQRYESMTAVSQESWIVGKFFRSLREDLDCVFVMTEVGDSPAEPDQIIGTWFCLGVLACLRKFRFKLAPRFPRERRRDLLSALQTRLREYWREA